MFVGKKAAAMVAASNFAVAEASRENAREIARSNDRLAGTLRENSKREVAARDRVDITLAEYMKMKTDIENLSAENRRLKALFGKIGLPFDVPIMPNSIQKYMTSGAIDFLGNTQGFLIRFQCDLSELSPEQRKYMTETFPYV